MPQNATVGLVRGFREDGAIGAPEEPAVFRRKTRAWFWVLAETSRRRAKQAQVLTLVHLQGLRLARVCGRQLHNRLCQYRYWLGPHAHCAAYL
jgi:hypothetical protein